MASSSTNKQPLLVDRPLHEAAIIGGMAGVSDPADLNTLIPSALALLVDCSNNDGAVVDSVSVNITEPDMAIDAGGDDPFIFCCLSDGATYHCICALLFDAATEDYFMGDRLNISLPPLCVPVPSFWGTSPDSLSAGPNNVVVDASAVDKKNTGILIPPGKQLYVGVNRPVTLPSTASRFVVTAQGGYF